MRRAIFSPATGTALFAIGTSILLIIVLAACHPATLVPTQEGNWIQSAEIPKYPRSNAVCFVIGDKAYVGTGFNETVPDSRNRLSDFWAFSVDSGWEQVRDFPGLPRSGAAAFSLGNYGYVGTGYDGLTVYNDFYQYDPVLNNWNAKNPYPGDARYDAVGFSVQGKGYIGSGYSNYWLNDFYQYDSATGTWTRTIGTSGDFSKRRGATAFVYQDKAYIVTGSTSGSMAKDFWRFDPSRSVPWTRLQDIINDNDAAYDDGYTDIEREYAVSFVHADSAYLTLGKNGSMLASTWVYDFTHDQWGQRSPYHRLPRYGAVAFTIDGRSFVGTGHSGAVTFDDFDEFLPYQPYNSND
jgi:N-acetylneuraminic acid mutarotase